jgi:hypothetical protein
VVWKQQLTRLEELGTRGEVVQALTCLHLGEHAWRQSDEPACLPQQHASCPLRLARHHAHAYMRRVLQCPRPSTRLVLCAVAICLSMTLCCNESSTLHHFVSLCTNPRHELILNLRPVRCSLGHEGCNCLSSLAATLVYCLATIVLCLC